MRCFSLSATHPRKLGAPAYINMRGFSLSAAHPRKLGEPQR